MILITKLNFKKSIVIFWAMWWLIAFWTDVVGGLAHMGLLHKNWAVDVNFPFLVTALKMYNPANWVPVVLYLGILLWTFIAALLFIRTCGKLNQKKSEWLKCAEHAFIVSLLFWLCLFLADQIVMKYDLEENHMVQGGFQLLSFLALYCLPDE